MPQEVLEKTEDELHSEFVGLFYENLGGVLEEAFDGEWVVSKYPGSITITGTLRTAYVSASWYYEKGEVVIATRRSFKSLVVTTTHRAVAKSLGDVVLAIIKSLVFPDENVVYTSIEAFVE
jgi:hypothetical protein